MKKESGIALLHLIILIGVIFLLLFGVVIFTISGGTINVTPAKKIDYNQEFFADKVTSYTKLKKYKAHIEYSGIMTCDMVGYNSRVLGKINTAGINMTMYASEFDDEILVLLDDYKYAAKSSYKDMEQEYEKSTMGNDNNFLTIIKQIGNEDYEFKYIPTDDISLLNFEMRIKNPDSEIKSLFTEQIGNKDIVVIKYWVDSKNYAISKLSFGLENNGDYTEQGFVKIEKDGVNASEVERPSLKGYKMVEYSQIAK